MVITRGGAVVVVMRARCSVMVLTNVAAEARAHPRRSAERRRSRRLE